MPLPLSSLCSPPYPRLRTLCSLNSAHHGAKADVHGSASQGSDGKVGRPDGAIIATRGSRTWTALVEVKTGATALTADRPVAIGPDATTASMPC